jgi:hypothetical protein
MLSRLALLSLFVGGCAQASLPRMPAIASARDAVSAETSDAPRAARTRRVARLTPPFAAPAAPRHVSAPELIRECPYEDDPHATAAFVPEPVTRAHAANLPR